MRMFEKIPSKQVKQALSELSREELEAFSFLTSVTLSVLAGRLYPGGASMPIPGIPGLEAEEVLLIKASEVSRRIQDRVVQLTTESN